MYGHARLCLTRILGPCTLKSSIYKRTVTTATMRLRADHFNPVKPPVQLEIELTEAESQLCTLLEACTQKLKEDENIITSCRIAGGWVRDKVNP